MSILNFFIYSRIFGKCGLMIGSHLDNYNFNQFVNIAYVILVIEKTKNIFDYHI